MMQLQNPTAHQLNNWMLVIQLIDVVFIAIQMFPYAELPGIVLLFAVPSILLHLYPRLKKNPYFEIFAGVISLVAVIICIGNIALLIIIQDPFGRAMFGAFLLFLALPSALLGASLMWIIFNEDSENAVHHIPHYQNVVINGKQISHGRFEI